MSPAEHERIRAQVRESRRRQGLPEHVQDASVLDRLAGRLLEQRAWAGNDDAATRRDQGKRAVPSGSASGAAQPKRPNSKGPGLTNRDLRKTTSHPSEEVIGA